MKDILRKSNLLCLHFEMEDEKIYLMSILIMIKEFKKGRRRMFDSFQLRFHIKIIKIVV